MSHGRWPSATRLALTTFTILPLPPGRTDRAAAGAAMTLAPAVGALLGAALAGVGLLARLAGASALLTAVVVVAAGVLATRALHLDGLADTLDALGSYRDRERALQIMKRSDIGPFGVVGILLVLGAQAAATATAAPRPPLALLATLVTGAGAGRLAVVVACRRGVPAARPTGLGALVAGTQPAVAALLGAVLLSAVGWLAVPGRGWLGPVAVLAAVATASVLVRHARRRLGGITGDVLGAAVEVCTTVSLVVLAL